MQSYFVILKGLFNKENRKAESGLPCELSKYQYCTLSGNLTEMLNEVNSFKREVREFLICMDKAVASEFPGFFSNLCRMYSSYRDIFENT